jgi:hypothetical protein
MVVESEKFEALNGIETVRDVAGLEARKTTAMAADETVVNFSIKASATKQAFPNPLAARFHTLSRRHPLRG